MENKKILHFTFGLPPKYIGGLTQYVFDLMKTQKEQGFDVFVLLPKSSFLSKQSIYSINNIFYIESSLPIASVYGVKNPSSYLSDFNKDLIKDFLTSLNPGIIHLHTLMGLPKEFLEVANELDIKIIFTTHDFYGICLKCTLLNYNQSICDGPASEACAVCNKASGFSTYKSFLLSSKIYRELKKNKLVNKIKTKYKDKNNKSKEDTIEKVMCTKEEIEKYEKLLNQYRYMFSLVNYFHFNSKLTEKIYRTFLPDIKGETKHITLLVTHDAKPLKKVRTDTLRIGYIGRNDAHKGLSLMMEAAEELANKNLNFKLYLFGDDFKKYDGYFSGKVINKGIYNNSQLEQVYSQIDILVVPSLSYETFGLVVSEAMAYNTVVLASDKVGAKDILDNKYQVFSTEDKSDLTNKLIDIIENPKELIKLQDDIKKSTFNYDIKEHSKKMIKLYEGCE